MATEEERRKWRQEEEERQKRESAELAAARDELTPLERRFYDYLQETFLDRLYDANVDVSFFPHAADMVVVAAAKDLAAIGR